MERSGMPPTTGGETIVGWNSHLKKTFAST
jgi:hypothetical protein